VWSHMACDFLQWCVDFDYEVLSDLLYFTVCFNKIGAAVILNLKSVVRTPSDVDLANIFAHSKFLG